ncbi:MAG: SURF1 family protein [Actinomycetota bacterium]
MYRFALRPKWIAGHLLALVAIVVFISAGFWQLRRLDERQAENADIAAVADLPPLELGLDTDDAGLVAWRTVTATGTWLTDDGVLVRNRSLDGQPGFHVVTPLLLDDGRALLVNRGWLPVTQVDDGQATSLVTPDGEVTVVGRLRDSQRARGLAASDPDDGVLDVVSRVDVDRLAQQIDVELLPLFAERIAEGDTSLPRAVPEPDLGEGPHLSYAVQWFLFTAVVAIGYPLVLRWAAHRGEEFDEIDEPDLVSA